MINDPAVALRRLGLDASGVSVEELAQNRWLTPGIWQVASSGDRMALKCLARNRPIPGSAWDAHWTRGAQEPTRWNYWAREGLAYKHGVVDAFEAGGIIARDPGGWSTT